MFESVEGRNRGEDGQAVFHGGLADFVAVALGMARLGRGVHHDLHLAVLDQVHHVRPSLRNFFDGFRRNPVFLVEFVSALRCIDLKAQLDQLLNQRQGLIFIRVGARKKDAALE